MHCSLPTKLQVQCIFFNKQPVQFSLRSRQHVYCNCCSLDPNPIDKFRIYVESLSIWVYLFILKKNYRIVSNPGWGCRAQQIFVYLCWITNNTGKLIPGKITITEISVTNDGLCLNQYCHIGSCNSCHFYLVNTRYFVNNLVDTTSGYKSNRQRDRALQWRHNSTSNGHHRSATLKQTIKYAESTPSLQFTILL